MSGQTRKSGFTIVELLIVIVIIAILATITIIAFNGITQRAKNSAKIATVESAIKLIRLHHAEHQAYPAVTDNSWCLTMDNKCTQYNGVPVVGSNAAVVTPLSAYGTLPSTSTDDITGTYYGIQYLYSASRTLQSVANPLLIVFWLEGENQMCAGTVSGMVSVVDSGGTLVPANRSKGDVPGGKTRCYMMFPN